MVVIPESHFSIHTWCEYGYCALDIFSCGTEIKSEKALYFLKEKFNASSISVTEVKRGILNYPIKIPYKPEVSEK